MDIARQLHIYVPILEPQDCPIAERVEQQEAQDQQVIDNCRPLANSLTSTLNESELQERITSITATNANVTTTESVAIESNESTDASSSNRRSRRQRMESEMTECSAPDVVS